MKKGELHRMSSIPSLQTKTLTQLLNYIREFSVRKKEKNEVFFVQTNQCDNYMALIIVKPEVITVCENTTRSPWGPCKLLQSEYIHSRHIKQRHSPAWLQSPALAAVHLLQRNPSCQSERNQLVRADTTNRNKCHSIMFRGTGFMDNFKQYLCLEHWCAHSKHLNLWLLERGR